MKTVCMVVCLAVLSGIAAAQTASAGAKIRVCVAPLENDSTRPVSEKMQMNRLVADLNQAKPGKHDADRRPIAAVALDQAERDTCDFTVRTRLVELREPGDPQSHVPGSISIGKDPLGGEPGVGIRNDIARHAIVQFDIERGGDTLVSSSASEQENMTADALVNLLMDRVAARTNSAVRQSKRR